MGGGGKWMNAITKKMLISQFIVHILAFLIILVIGILSTPGYFEQSYVLERATAFSFINYIRFFIPITLTGFAICFSASIRHSDTASLKSTSFFGVIRGALAFLLFLTLIYILFIFLLWPWSYRKRADVEFRSEFVNSRIEQGIEYLNLEEYSLAERTIESVLALIPLQSEAVEIYKEIQALRPETPVVPQPEEVAPVLPLGLEYNEISARAEQYFNEEDYFSALFYARLALGPGETRSDPQSRRILTESLKIIDRLDLSEAEQDEQELFYLKRSGAQAYNSGEYINAYYIFKEIQSFKPLDADAETYLTDIQPRIADISFFIDEIDVANSGEIRRNVFTRLPGSREEETGEPGEQKQHFLAAEQMMRSNTGLYFINLEYLEIDLNGRITLHIRIPRAKMSGTYLITRVIDRERPGEIYQPQYLQGEGREDLLAISATDDELWLLNPASVHFNDVNIIQLVSLSRLYPQFGRSPTFPQVEILYRILLPLSLIVCSLFIISLSWRQRSRYLAGPPGYTLIFFPLVIFFLFIFFELYILFCRNILTAILLLGNFGVSLTVLIGLQVLLFIGILLRSAGKKST